jgi:hypothetical protein
MKITEKLAALGKADEPYFSLEFFPPKTDMVFASYPTELTLGTCQPSIPIEPYG